MPGYFKILSQTILNFTVYFKGIEQYTYLLFLLVCSFWKFIENFALSFVMFRVIILCIFAHKSLGKGAFKKAKVMNYWFFFIFNATLFVSGLLHMVNQAFAPSFLRDKWPSVRTWRTSKPSCPGVLLKIYLWYADSALHHWSFSFTATFFSQIHIYTAAPVLSQTEFKMASENFWFCKIHWEVYWRQNQINLDLILGSIACKLCNFSEPEISHL